MMNEIKCKEIAVINENYNYNRFIVKMKFEMLPLILVTFVLILGTELSCILVQA